MEDEPTINPKGCFGKHKRLSRSQIKVIAPFALKKHEKHYGRIQNDGQRTIFVKNLYRDSGREELLLKKFRDDS